MVRSGKPSLTRGHDERLVGSKKVSHTDNLLKEPPQHPTGRINWRVGYMSMSLDSNYRSELKV